MGDRFARLRAFFVASMLMGGAIAQECMSARRAAFGPEDLQERLGIDARTIPSRLESLLLEFDFRASDFDSDVENLIVYQLVKHLHAKASSKEGKSTCEIYCDARGYLPGIYRRLDERRVPRAFAFIPAIESQFDPRAINRTSDAKGLWQWNGITLRHVRETMGISLDPFDVQASNEVVARIFAENQRSLKSWPLTLLAHNAGVSRVAKAADPDSLENTLADLSLETRCFYKRFVAWTYVFDFLEENPSVCR